MPDASDGLDLWSLAVGAPVPPVLIVSTVSFTLHDVLLASVARVLIAHEAERNKEDGKGNKVRIKIAKLKLYFYDLLYI